MRKLIASAVLLISGLVAWACVPAGQSVFLVSAQGLTPACEVEFDIERTFGSVNIAETSNYFVAFSMESTLVPNETEVNGQPVDSPSSNDFIGNQAILNYFSVENGVRTPLPITQQIQPILAVVAPGSDREGSYITMDLFTPAAATAIRALPTPIDVIASVRIDGQLRGGSRMSTNTIEFPVRTFNVAAATSCAADEEPVIVAGACGNPTQDAYSPGIVCTDIAAADAGVVTLDPSSF